MFKGGGNLEGVRALDGPYVGFLENNNSLFLFKTCDCQVET